MEGNRKILRDIRVALNTRDYMIFQPGLETGAGIPQYFIQIWIGRGAKCPGTRDGHAILHIAIREGVAIIHGKRAEYEQ